MADLDLKVDTAQVFLGLLIVGVITQVLLAILEIVIAPAERALTQATGRTA